MCKNLFLCNRQKTAFYLLLLPGHKPLHSKDLSAQLGVARLSFADTASISVWARDSVARMTALGLIRGAENNRFFPQRTTTRAEAATVMLRIYDHLH